MKDNPGYIYVEGVEYVLGEVYDALLENSKRCGTVIEAQKEEIEWYASTMMLCCMIADMEPDDPMWEIAKLTVKERVAAWRIKNEEAYDEGTRELTVKVADFMKEVLAEEAIDD